MFKHHKFNGKVEIFPTSSIKSALFWTDWTEKVSASVCYVFFTVENSEKHIKMKSKPKFNCLHQNRIDFVYSKRKAGKNIYGLFRNLFGSVLALQKFEVNFAAGNHNKNCFRRKGIL